MFLDLLSHPEDVLLITLDSCRFDTFLLAETPALDQIAPSFRAKSPSYFTYGSHAAMWMGFTPGVAESGRAWLNPKRGKLFRMQFSGASSSEASQGFTLSGANIIDGFRRQGYLTLGTGAVAWFDPATETGSVLSSDFDHFFYPGNTWSLAKQLAWLKQYLQNRKQDQPVFLFLNIGETHVPYWFEGANWSPWPTPCKPFGGSKCSRRTSRDRQIQALQWVDAQLASLIQYFLGATILACADHGDCWGENGLWEHGVSHSATLTVPLLMRVRGMPVDDPKLFFAKANRYRRVRHILYKCSQALRATFRVFCR